MILVKNISDTKYNFMFPEQLLIMIRLSTSSTSFIYQYPVI